MRSLAGSYIYKQSYGSIVRPHSLLVNCHEIHECRNFHRYPLRFCLFHTLGSTYFTSTQGRICSTRHLSKQQDRLDCWSTSQRYMVWPIHLTELNHPEGRRSDRDTSDAPVNITNKIGMIFLRKGGLTTNCASYSVIYHLTLTLIV